MTPKQAAEAYLIIQSDKKVSKWAKGSTIEEFCENIFKNLENKPLSYQIAVYTTQQMQFIQDVKKIIKNKAFL